MTTRSTCGIKIHRKLVMMLRALLASQKCPRPSADFSRNFHSGFPIDAERRRPSSRLNVDVSAPSLAGFAGSRRPIARETRNYGSQLLGREQEIQIGEKKDRIKRIVCRSEWKNSTLNNPIAQSFIRSLSEQTWYLDRI